MRRKAIATGLVLVALIAFAKPAAAEVVTPTLVRVVDTSQFSPPSPDPMGIGYRTSTNTLFISDSEIEEMSIWQNKNVWEISPTGSVQHTGTTSPTFSNEPTGIAVNPSNGHIYISDDDADKIFEVTLGPSGIIGNSDETVTSFSIRTFPADAEDVAYGAGSLFIADGSGTEIWRDQPGPNGRFEGTGDDVITHFDTSTLGQPDVEGVAYNFDAGTLFIGSRKTKIVAEVTLGGSLIRTFDLTSSGIRNVSGIAFGTTSNNAGYRSIYVVDRGTDNNTDPNENDGKMFEFRVAQRVNGAPVVTNPGAQSGSEGSAVSLQIQASDPDNDALTYSANNLPPGLSINSSTGRISGTVSAGASSNSPYGSSVTASDGSLSDTESFTWTIGTAPPPSIEIPVRASSDDAEESVSSGGVNLTSTDLELVTDGSTVQTVGMRFTGVGVPAGATITNAYVQFTVDEVSTGAAPLTVKGQAADNPATFQTTNLDVSSRPRTTASATWSPPDWNTVGQAGTDQRTPNLSAVIQQIVGRSGWASGNAMVIIVTGTGRRTAGAFDGSTPEPILHIEYQTAPTNGPPVVTNPGSQTNTEGNSVSLQIQATDPDNDNLTYSASGLPPGLSINSNTGRISGTVSAGATTNSPYSSSVSASDGSLSDTKNFTWTINAAPPVNQPPVVTNPGSQTNTEENSVSLQIQATDPDNDTLAYSAANLPPGLSINSNTGLITGTVSAGAATNSPYSSSVSASDGSLSDTKNFTWTINAIPPVNQPPVVTNPGPQSSGEGQAVSLQIQATDPNNDTLTYSASNLPPGLSINTGNGLISGTVSGGAATNSPYSSSVTASDGSLSDSKNFTWTVFVPNGAPVVTNPGSQTNAEGISVSLQIQATDPNNDTLTYSAGNLPPGLSINTGNGLISGTVSAGAATNSPYSSSVTASDGSLSDTKNFTWTITDASAPATPSGLGFDAQTTGLALDWSNNTESDLAGYNVYRLAGASYSKLNASLLTASDYFDAQAPANATSFYRVTAVDSHGNESTPASGSEHRSSIVYVGASSAHGRATSVSLAKPAGTATGDLLLAAIAVRGAVTVTPPAGWAIVQDTATSGSLMRQVVLSHIVAAGETGPYSFPLGARQGFASLLVAYRGAAIDTSGSQANASSNSITAPSVNAANAESVEIGFFGIATSTSINPPSGMIERGEDTRSSGGSTSKVTIEVSDDVVGSGSLGSRIASSAAAQVNVGQAIVLSPTG